MRNNGVRRRARKPEREITMRLWLDIGCWRKGTRNSASVSDGGRKGKRFLNFRRCQDGTVAEILGNR